MKNYKNLINSEFQCCHRKANFDNLLKMEDKISEEKHVHFASHNGIASPIGSSSAIKSDGLVMHTDYSKGDAVDSVSNDGKYVKESTSSVEEKQETRGFFEIAANYIAALRPWSFSASLTPILLGTALGYRKSGEVNYLVLLFTAVAILSVHAAGNLVNTYYDFLKGIDSKKSDDRTLVDNRLTPQEVAFFGASLYGVGCIALLILGWIAKARIEHMALLYFGGLSSSFLYTGGIGLKYHAFGDVVILLSFGPLAVMFSYICQTGLLELTPFWYAIPLALNTEAILHSNNARDMDSDKAANVTTIAIMLGATASYVLYCLLLFIPYIMLTILGCNFSMAFLLPFLSLTVAFKLEKEFRRGELDGIPQKTAKLNLIFGGLYVISCLLADRESMPGL